MVRKDISWLIEEIIQLQNKNTQNYDQNLKLNLVSCHCKTLGNKDFAANFVLEPSECWKLVQTHFSPKTTI